ncbi:MAG TPA: hypothetical protein PK788_10325 [Gemmatimonadaceae bacterium]|nr:hypothetical protein [Gemmatimonadaceae bacterium]
MRPLAALALVLAFALPSALVAQDGLPPLSKLEVPTVEYLEARMGRAQPGVAASSPVGFGPNQGDIFVGLGYQASTGVNGAQDGAISVGGGFLNSGDIVGIEAVLTSLSTIRSGFGSRMVGAVKVHKVVQDWGLGLGVEGFYLNGNDFDTKPSVYVAATRGFHVNRGSEYFTNGTINFGLGNGRFQQAEDFRDGKNGVWFFASSSIRINYFSSAIIDYTGAQVNLALSFSPLKNIPLVLTPSLNDVGGAVGDRARLALGAGMSWKY